MNSLAILTICYYAALWILIALAFVLIWPELLDALKTLGVFVRSWIDGARWRVKR